MMSRNSIFEQGLIKLAEGLEDQPPRRQEEDLEPKKKGVQYSLNPLHPVSPREVEEAQGYGQASMLGALSGGATGVILGGAMRKNPFTYGAIGAGSGLLAAIARHYDQAADPPGLSPVYTVPAGARLGTPVGAVTGGLLGKVTKFGIIPGALLGAAAGGVGGSIVSGMV